jgi:hypothetical protein
MGLELDLIVGGQPNTPIVASIVYACNWDKNLSKPRQSQYRTLNVLIFTFPEKKKKEKEKNFCTCDQTFVIWVLS